MIIGLTGGIGSGKSTVSEYLIGQGYPVVDADDVARQVVELGKPALKQLAEVLGADILKEDGTLDRAKTADLVFSDPDKKKAMDEIMWTAIGEVIREELAEYEKEGHKLIFLDAALLLESGVNENVDAVWVVHADEDVRIERVMERDDVDAGAVRARMGNQFSEQQRLDMADEILDNNGSVGELLDQVAALLDRVSKDS